MTMDSAGRPAVAKAEGDEEVPTIWVDLSKETFQLTDHQRWHARED